MKIIEIFLASSIKEFTKERMAIRAFCADIEDVLDDYGYAIKLFVCEEFDPSIQAVRTQDKYNEFIRRPCEIFFSIYGKKAGEYTIEEMNVAIDTYNKYQKPVIHIGFVSNVEQYDNENLKAVYKMAIDSAIINEFEYSENSKESLTQLKLAFLTAIKKSEPEIEIEITESEVFVFGERVMVI